MKMDGKSSFKGKNKQQPNKLKPKKIVLLDSQMAIYIVPVICSKLRKL